MSFDGFHALLFDCDGTIADSMPLHLRAWNEALNPHGAHMTEQLHDEWAGRPTAKIVEMLNQKFNLHMPIEKTVDAKESAYLKLMPSVLAVPEVLDVIKEYHGKIPLAVVSGSPRASVIKTLNHLGLRDRFDVVLGSEDYSPGKPNPNCYLEAARRLAVPPEKCLVFEDAELGVMAAQAAKMAYVRVNPRLGRLPDPARV
jgi:HAD superfamily hydrolase (TIGR01509 family)